MNNLTKSKAAEGRFILICTALLWGLAGLCVKSITWSTLSIIAVRSIISLIMLICIRRSIKLKFSKTNILGAIMMSVTGILYVAAIKLTTAGTAIVLQYTAPILVFLFAVIFRGKKAKISEVILTLAVFAGCVLSFADSLDFTRILGNLLAIASGITYAGQIIVMNEDGCDTQDCTIISNAISFVVCLPFLFIDKPVFDLHNIIWILVLSIFQYGLANILFAKGIQMVDSVEASLLLSIEPVFNPIPVAIFCGEHMGTLALIGSAVVIVSIALYSLLPKLQRLKTS